MIIKILLLFFFLCVLNGCGQHAATVRSSVDTANDTKRSTVVVTSLSFDSSTIALLSNKDIRFFSLKDSLPAVLTSSDLQRIDTLLLACVRVHNKNIDSNKVYAAYIRPEKYKRQYVPYTGATGDKKVFINCFCKGINSFPDWKDKLVEIEDGGFCFFNVTINLSTGTSGSILINGPG